MKVKHRAFRNRDTFGLVLSFLWSVTPFPKKMGWTILAVSLSYLRSYGDTRSVNQPSLKKQIKCHFFVPMSTCLFRRSLLVRLYWPLHECKRDPEWLLTCSHYRETYVHVHFVFLSYSKIVAPADRRLKCVMTANKDTSSYAKIIYNWGLPCNSSIDAWRHLLSLFSSDEMIGNLSENLNTEYSPKKLCRYRGAKTAQNWSRKLFFTRRIFSKKN